MTLRPPHRTVAVCNPGGHVFRTAAHPGRRRASGRPAPAGARQDLAGRHELGKVRSPTLLLVGGAAPEVLTLNRSAWDQLSCTKELVVIPGACYSFEEAGALDEVARLDSDWFDRHWRQAPIQ